MEQVMEREEVSENEAPPACDQEAKREEAQNEDEIEPSQPAKRVRLNSAQPEDKVQTTTSHQKMTIKRRRTSDKNPSAKRVRMSRTSLPASIAPNGVEESTTVQDFTFSPLSTVLEKRMRERKASFPDGRIDNDAEEEVMSDRLVLDTQDEVVYPQLGGVSQKAVPNRAAREDEEAVVLSKRVSSSMSEEERTNFANAVVQLQRESNIAKARLRVLCIQVQALGFGDYDEEETDEAKAELALKSIRQSFDACRAFLDEELPGTLPDEASNEDLLSIFTANIKTFVSRLIRANREAMGNASLTTDLTRQISHLLDRLTDEKLKSGQLRKDNDVAVERLVRISMGNRSTRTTWLPRWVLVWIDLVFHTRSYLRLMLTCF
jgi:hypothetical protein